MCVPSVGAGSAGCVLADRLSEDGSATVLLLEAGDEETKYSLLNIPLTAFDHQQTELDWSYLTEPQTNASLSYKDQVGVYRINILIHVCNCAIAVIA